MNAPSMDDLIGELAEMRYDAMMVSRRLGEMPNAQSARDAAKSLYDAINEIITANREQPAVLPNPLVPGVYETREGQRISIISNDLAEEYPFFGSNDQTYTVKGRVFTTDFLQSWNDLVRCISIFKEEPWK